MFSGARKLWLIALFTVVLIAVVNVAAWLFYNQTEHQLDSLLGRRLAAIAATASVLIPPDVVSGLEAFDLHAFVRISDKLEEIRQSDSLSEVFILNDDYEYLATTQLLADSLYFLAPLNGVYIDSLFFGWRTTALPSATYRTGRLFLKSAFAPLRDTTGKIAAVLGVEANVDYFTSLDASRTNLLYASGLSLAGGLLFGLVFLLLQRRLIQAEARLFQNETHAYLGRMAAVVSHKIKNPLMIIRASAERLAKKHQVEEAAFVVEEVDRLNDIVTGYLDFARSGGSKDASLVASEKSEQINLVELIADIRRQFQTKYPDDEITWLDPDTTATNLVTTGYRRSLRQVILNLLINGAQACLDAGKPIAVGVMAERAGGHIRIVVSDHGPGLSKSQLQKAFDPFYTTRTHGSGLGLYLSRKLVTDMGGTLEIASRKTLGGTKAVITFKDR
jgi:signal transduction histidine kinase